MSSNPNLTEGTPSSGQLGGNGSYSSGDTQEDSSLRVRLGDHLDPQLRRSLESGQSPTTRSLMDFVKRNPVPLALAAGGLIWLLTSSSRRFRR